MQKIKSLSISAFILFMIPLWISGCQAISTANTSATEDATAPESSSRQTPERVDIRGFITQQEYNQGQMLIQVEGNIDPFSRFNRAIVLVTPVTQIVGLDGNTISLSELRTGQRVAIQFRGRYRESVTGFSAQAIARKMWIEPLVD